MISKNLIMHIISQSKGDSGLLVGEIKKRIQAAWPIAPSFSINTVRRQVYELVDDGYLKCNPGFNNSVKYTLSDKPNDINLYYIGVGKLDDDSFAPSYARLWEGKDKTPSFIKAIIDERHAWLEDKSQVIVICARKKKIDAAIDFEGNIFRPPYGLFSDEYCRNVFGF